MIKKLINRYRSSKMIRNAIDTYPDGICFAAPDGRPILVNKRMNEVCWELTGRTITNATDMWQSLGSKAIYQEDGDTAGAELLLRSLKDGTVWQLQRKTLMVEGSGITQYEASDITELYEYRNRLEENNLRVKDLHGRQRELLDNIVQNNLDKELLSTKMRIHDAFGRLLIMTKNTLIEGREEENGPEPTG